MIHRYVKPLGSVINEAAEPQSKATYDAELKKYEGAKKKNEEQYQQYVSGKTTREQYMAWFTQFLDMERALRLAEVNYKLDSARGTEEGAGKKKQQKTEQTPPTNQQTAGTEKPPLPG